MGKIKVKHIEGKFFQKNFCSQGKNGKEGHAKKKNKARVRKRKNPQNIRKRKTDYRILNEKKPKNLK